jgi:hypothetical protein
MTELTAKTVHAIIMDSLFHKGEVEVGEIPDKYIEARGPVRGVGFHPERLESHRAEVIALLDELPDEFKSVANGGGDGWSFLNAVVDKHGKHWGEHPDAEALLLLGLGLGLVEYLLPRESWSIFPGGMPYFRIL